MNTVRQDNEPPLYSNGTVRRQDNRSNTSARSLKRRTTLLLPLVLYSFFGEPVQASAQHVENGSREQSGIEQILDLEGQAADGNLEAMYWLGMLHIEGKISDANYEKGSSLLRQAAARGHVDADRMWSFMNNAFSGDGC